MNTPTIKNTLAAIAALTAVATAPTFAQETATPTATVTGDQASKHFEAVAGHLDLGGVVFGYVDIDGDAEKIAVMVNEFLAEVRKIPNADMPPQIAMLDAKGLLDDLGLTGIEAMGVSSYKNGDLHRNNYYLHVPEGRKGLLKILGGDAAPFAARELAPAGSDLIMELDLDLKSGFELAAQIVMKVAGPEAALEMAQATSQPMGDFKMSVAEIFKHLDTKLTVVGRLHPDKPLPLPEEVPFKVPGIDLLVAIDGAGPIFEKLIETIPEDQRGQILSEGDGYQQAMLPVRGGMAQIVQPVLRHYKESGRVLAGSSSAFLDEALAGESSVWDDADFKAAMEGLPETGNALSYVSAEFGSEYLRVYGEAMKLAQQQGGMGVGLAEMLVSLIEELGMSREHGQASVMANLPEGVLIAENAIGSAKQNIIAAGVGGAAVFVGAMMPLRMAASNEARAAAEWETREAERAIEEIERSSGAADSESGQLAPAPGHEPSPESP